MKRGRSLLFKLTKKFIEICLEIRRLLCANVKLEIVRSISHIQLYHGATDILKVKQRQNSKDFMSKHLFEAMEEKEPTIIPNERQSSQDDTFPERI